jgi:hypothetical protein
MYMAERRPELRIEVAARSAVLPRERGFPTQMSLFRVDPAGGEASSRPQSSHPPFVWQRVARQP